LPCVARCATVARTDAVDLERRIRSGRGPPDTECCRRLGGPRAWTALACVGPGRVAGSRRGGVRPARPPGPVPGARHVPADAGGLRADLCLGRSADRDTPAGASPGLALPRHGPRGQPAGGHGPICALRAAAAARSARRHRSGLAVPVGLAGSLADRRLAHVVFFLLAVSRRPAGAV
jgi:hypothetical protein